MMSNLNSYMITLNYGFSNLKAIILSRISINYCKSYEEKKSAILTVA